MVRILADEHLERLQCSKCRKYLSVFPVRNHANHRIACGRCSRDDNDGVGSVLYELIAKEFLFKCVNRFEGCKTLLRVDETVAHERECVGRGFKCPKCKDDVEWSVLELIWHYKLKHPSSYLKKNSFEGKPPIEDIMLYTQEDVVFFVLFQHEPILNILCLNAVTLTRVDARQAFMVSNGQFCKHTKKKSCRSINAPREDEDYFRIEFDSIESVKVVFNLEVTTNDIFYDISSSNAATVISNDKMCKIESPLVFKKKYGCELNERGTALVSNDGKGSIDLTCSNCKQIIGLPIFKCASGYHNLCYSCRNGCSICPRKNSVTEQNSGLLFQMSSHLRFPCKWKCGGYFVADLRIHERACEWRFMNCPECQSKVHLNFMESHLFEFHQNYFCEDYDVKAIERFVDKEKNGKVYFLLNDKWCFLKWSSCVSQDNFNKISFDFGKVSDELNIELTVRHCGNIIRYKHLEIELNHLIAYTPHMKFG